MKVTDIRIRRIESESKVKAYVSITFDDVFAVHEVKIIEGDKGLFIAMPCRKYGNEFKDIVHPICTEFRQYLQDAVITEYNKLLEEVKQDE